MILKVVTVGAVIVMLSATAMAAPKGLSLAVQGGVDPGKGNTRGGLVVMYDWFGADLYSGGNTDLGVDLRVNIASIEGPSAGSKITSSETSP